MTKKEADARLDRMARALLKIAVERAELAEREPNDLRAALLLGQAAGLRVASEFVRAPVTEGSVR